MLLSIRFLNAVANINSFEHAPQLEMSSGDAQTVFFQLIDASLDRAESGFSPAGRRYCPPASSTLSVQFVNVDDAKQFTRFAVQPFSGDTSMWSIPILSTDPLLGTTNLKLVLQEPGRRLNVNITPGVMLRVR